MNILFPKMCDPQHKKKKGKGRKKKKRRLSALEENEEKVGPPSRCELQIGNIIAEQLCLELLPFLGFSVPPLPSR